MLQEAAVVRDKGTECVEGRVWDSMKRSICMIDTRSPKLGKGSGFIAQLQFTFPPASYTVLVTCHHVIPDWDTAEQCDVYFDKVDGDGFKITGKDLFQRLIWKTCEKPDYSVLGVNSEVLKHIPNGPPIPISLHKCEKVALNEGDMLYIIHHPKNKAHMRCINGYVLKKIIGPVLTHLMTTHGGSSGAPVFKVVDDEPVAVAVHAGAIPPPPQQPVVNVSYLISDIVHHMPEGKLKNAIPSMDEVLKESQPSLPPPQQIQAPEEDKQCLTIEDLQPYFLKLSPHLLQLGTAFKVYDFTESIRYAPSPPQNKVQEVLQYWIQVSESTTWEDFYRNLRLPGLDMHSLAVQIAKKHCPHVLNN